MPVIASVRCQLRFDHWALKKPYLSECQPYRENAHRLTANELDSQSSAADRGVFDLSIVHLLYDILKCFSFGHSFKAKPLKVAA